MIDISPGGAFYFNAPRWPDPVIALGGIDDMNAFFRRTVDPRSRFSADHSMRESKAAGPPIHDPADSRDRREQIDRGSHGSPPDLCEEVKPGHDRQARDRDIPDRLDGFLRLAESIRRRLPQIGDHLLESFGSGLYRDIYRSGFDDGELKISVID
ncbi:MAG: hypothetical protein IIB89_05645, partial [Chloroflexi bacterium]|nr:hypothetical protein [Chloroflexota bacterium]